MTSRRFSALARLALVCTTLVVPSVLPSSAGATLTHPPTLIASITRDDKVATCGPVVAISGDGHYIVFLSGPQVFRRDLRTGSTQLASASPEGRPAEFAADQDEISISGNGRFVAFVSRANNIAPETGGSSRIRLSSAICAPETYSW